MLTKEFPFPPDDMLRMVGSSTSEVFDRPLGFDHTNLDLSHVLDFGCGCGRIARKLLPLSQTYTGVDINLPMIEWCAKNLRHPDVFSEFRHLDVHSLSLNPSGVHKALPLPVPSSSITTAFAWSVFTHIVEENLEFNLREVTRVLAPGGTLLSTWFLFDKVEFPFLQDFQNALYIQIGDPTNAVVYDKTLLSTLFRSLGLHIVDIQPPAIKGFQWLVTARKEPGGHVTFPVDTAPVGIERPPL